MFLEKEFTRLISPWYESLQKPHESQEKTLLNLLSEYRKTHYGGNRNAHEVETVSDFKSNFPTVNYKGLTPYLREVREGSFKTLLPEPPVCWVMTRGSTGSAKVLPATKTHLQQIFTCGSRALLNYALKKKDFEIFSGKILNLNFPSNVHTMEVEGRETTYGYSSGTYAKFNPMFKGVSLIPSQEEIDALGSGILKRNWEERFELTFQRAVEKDVVAAIGVTPVILSFAQHVKKKHGKRPKELWKLKALFCTSVRKIQSKYASILRRYFGEIPVVEIYSATEGVFAQQFDELPYVSPNYDKYFFEVVVGGETKMLHELKRGEWGRLIVSSCMLPRYDIGDLIEAAGKNYFRVIGRNRFATLLEHRLYRLFFRWFI